MKSYCLNWKIDNKNINPRGSNTSNSKTTLLSKCAKCGSKKSRFIKIQEAKGLLNNLGIRTPLSKVPWNAFKTTVFTYSACRPFTKNKVRIQKSKETGDTNYIYKNELDRACFQHDIACEDFKDWAKEQFLIKF